MADFMGPAWGDLMDLLDAPVFAPITASIPDNCPGVHGDPHVATLDGRGYDFQAAGEFVGLVAPDIEVQFRFEPWGSSNSVSITTGVAIDVAGSIVQVDPMQDGRVLVDGEEVTEPVTTLGSGGTLAIRGGSVLVLWPEDQYRIGIDTGGAALDVQVISTADIAGQASGLLGDADGDPDNDPSVNGETIDPGDDDALYGSAAEAWRVTDENTLFTYTDGQGPDSFWIADYPTESVNLDPEVRDQARRDCIEAGVYRLIPLRDCVLDVALTGDDTFIDSALARQGNPTSTIDQVCLDALGPSRAVGRLAPDRRGVVPGPVPAGQVDWRALTEGGAEIGGHVAGDEDIVVASGSHLTALDAVTGDVRWSLTNQSDRDISGRRQPVLVGDLVITTNRSGHRLHLREDGTLCGQVHLGDSDPTAPVVVDGRLVTVGTFGAPAVVGIDLATGEHWVRPLVDIRSGAAVGRDLVVTTSEAGIVAIEAATGAVAWELERDGPVHETPVVVGDMVVANDSSSGLFAVDLQTGNLNWEAEHEGGVINDALAATDEVVVTVGSSDNLVVAADVTTGEQMWSLQLEGDAPSPPVIVGDIAWMATREDLVGLSLSDGSEVARNEGLTVKNMDGLPGGLVGGDAALDVIVIR